VNRQVSGRAFPALLASLPEPVPVSALTGDDPGRALAQVLAELMLAEAELERLDMSLAGNEPNDLQDLIWSRLADTIWLRRDEAKAMIAAATGVPWSSIEGANL
jgi:hypothetical protein